jgi:endonuclease/exonuclease/phosphatase family metal-dependent hydrolase
VLAALAVALLAPRVASAQADGLRILSYNTALMYFRGSFPYPLPVPACTSCDPFQFPPGPPGCYCPTIGLWWNDNDFTGTTFFSGVDELTRAQLIADRIVATDQDVVVLQEVFSDEARKVFVDTLAASGPYKHYVRKLRGVPPFPNPKVSDYAALGLAWADDFPLLLDVEIDPLDSGLMLFSRHPLLPLTGGWIPNDAVCGQAQCQFEGWNNGAALPVSHVAFKVYDKASGSDAFASKGVGLVKINGPGGPSYVAFTHMQSDADSEGRPAREAQLATIRDVIVGAVPAGELSDDRPVFVAGDLNTYGHHRKRPGQEEWHDIHDPSQATVADGFFGCGNGVMVNGVAQPCRFGANGDRALTDSWGFETSTSDEANDGRRLDYILHSSAGGRVCMQHAMIAWDLQADPDGNGGKHWLSDHRPIRADFNQDARWCSANDDKTAAGPIKNARLLPFGPTNCDNSPGPPNPDCKQDEIIAPPLARIQWGGGFQWFKIDRPGSYSIDLDPAVPTAKVDYVVYRHTDLSRPIQPFDPLAGEWGIIYTMPDPPYYIRTFAVDAQGKPDRTAKNRDYTLKVHQHLCRTPVDACGLEPGTTPRFVSPQTSPAQVDPLGSYVWPQTVLNNPLTDLRELWFRFKTSGVQDGRPSPMSKAAMPTVRMFIEAGNQEGYGCVTAKPPVIEEYNDGLMPNQLVKSFPFEAVEVDQDKDWDDDTLVPDDRRLAPELPGDTWDELKIYFVRLRRNSDVQDGFNVCNGGLTSSVSYHTNLTYVVPVNADATGELDDDVSADDNLCISMGFDHDGYAPPCGLPSAVDLTFDVPIDQALHGYEKLKGYYVGQVWPNFFEADENERLFVWSPDAPFTGLGTLDEWHEGQESAFHLADDEPGEGDYTYLVTYRRCHVATHEFCTNIADDP